MLVKHAPIKLQFTLKKCNQPCQQRARFSHTQGSVSIKGARLFHLPLLPLENMPSALLCISQCSKQDSPLREVELTLLLPGWPTPGCEERNSGVHLASSFGSHGQTCP